MATTEPPKPQRGLTAEERGRDVSPAQAEAEAAPTTSGRFGAAARPGFLLSQADGYPVGVKQFLQFCLILIYPGWLFALLFMWVTYGVFWVVFSPLRLWMKRNRPEDYAASQRK
ncbi:MAG: hypothetical protein QOI73_3650 [Solirubrobacteraceae bacterium]|jgi:YggT family protein|nr:hypothetical protein [Solirubrobacteraceae bacterium]